MKNNLKSIYIVIITTLLSSCGGGLSVAGNDGITGTGITTGTITGFGSIYVNGIKFDVDTAEFSRDGVILEGQTVKEDQDEFEIGEYVVIKDTIYESGLRKANEVIFEDLLDGAVTEISAEISPGISTIRILGQLVEVDHDANDVLNNTKLIDDVNNKPTFELTELFIGNIVEVSGVKDSEGTIKATSLKFKEESGSENELKGIISDIDLDAKTFMIGNILIDYNEATLDDGFNGDPEDGQFVEINSSMEYNGVRLFADEVELEDEYLVVNTDTELEMEGIVTRYVSNTDFEVNGIAVTTTSETEYHNGSPTDIAENTHLEVKGKVDSSEILVAEEIEFED